MTLPVSTRTARLRALQEQIRKARVFNMSIGCYCIIGQCERLEDSVDAGDFLSLSREQYGDLFFPNGWRYPPKKADRAAAIAAVQRIIDGKKLGPDWLERAREARK